MFVSMNKVKTGLLAGAALLGFAVACGTPLDELLLDALCLDDEDCAPSQNCVFTGYQVTGATLGWCRNDSSCSLGAQPGCGCKQGTGGVYDCQGTTEPTVTESVEGSDCGCVYPCSDINYGASGCPGGLSAYDPEDETPTNPENHGAGCVCVIAG